jgi:hypothetical protein
MASAKDIRVAPIKAADAREYVRKHHYSGKVTNNSSLHLGVFLGKQLEGVMQFGCPMDKRKSLTLVMGTPWHGVLELNRMVFGDRLPRNSESRAIAMSMRLIRKNYPSIEWVLSFADATQCGDGTIYRASGFVLTSIKPNKQILRLADGSIVARKTLDNPNHMGPDGRYGSAHAREAGAVFLPGFQLRYIYFLNPTARERLTVPILPFSKITEMGASMYCGERTRPKQATAGSTGTAAGQNRPGRSNISTAGTSEPA